MVCNNCGCENEEQYKFCMKCGNPLECNEAENVDSQPQQNENTVQPIQQPEQQPAPLHQPPVTPVVEKKGPSAGAIIGIALAAVAVIACILVCVKTFVVDKNDSNVSSSVQSETQQDVASDDTKQTSTTEEESTTNVPTIQASDKELENLMSMASNCFTYLMDDNRSYKSSEASFDDVLHHTLCVTQLKCFDFYFKKETIDAVDAHDPLTIFTESGYEVYNVNEVQWVINNVYNVPGKIELKDDEIVYDKYEGEENNPCFYKHGDKFYSMLIYWGDASYTEFEIIRDKTIEGNTHEIVFVPDIGNVGYSSGITVTVVAELKNDAKVGNYWSINSVAFNDDSGDNTATEETTDPLEDEVEVTEIAGYTVNYFVNSKTARNYNEAHQNLFIRSTPIIDDSKSNVLGRIPYDARITVHGYCEQDHNWYYVSYTANGKTTTGFSYSKYVVFE